MKTVISQKFCISMVILLGVAGIIIGCNKSSGGNSSSLLALAGGFRQTAKLIDTNTGPAVPAANDMDGQRVSISGDGGTIAMGSWWSDKYGYTNNGTTLVYRPVDKVWTQIAESSGGGNNMSQGSVALSGDGNEFVQGAWQNSSSMGSAFLQTWNTDHYDWVALAGGSSAGDMLGGCVAISGDGAVAAVGAIGASSGKGEVKIFVNSSGWTEKQTITASDAAADDNFGSSISISQDGGFIVVGAPGWNNGGIVDAGAVYIFKKSASAWSWGSSNHETQKITTTISGTNGQFGVAVAISPDASVIAANVYGTGINGMAVIITMNSTLGTWEEHWDASPSGGFGGSPISVALSQDGSVLAVGVASYGTTLANQGAVFVFYGKNGVWSCKQTLTAKDAASGDVLGTSVSMSADGTIIVAGAPGCLIGSNAGQGAAYVFSR
jgi:hypothetical protein